MRHAAERGGRSSKKCAVSLSTFVNFRWVTGGKRRGIEKQDEGESSRGSNGERTWVNLGDGAVANEAVEA